MVKRMLIDATHREETRIVVLDGNRLEEFDFESSTKQQLKGNIYLAKVTRVEPSLQAAFVEYGGNRHGFLAFNEIHPDYYRIPVADREALIAEVAANAAEPEPEPDRSPREERALLEVEQHEDNGVAQEVTNPVEYTEFEELGGRESQGEASAEPEESGAAHASDEAPPAQGEAHAEADGNGHRESARPPEPQVETLGGDEVDEQPVRRHRGHRHYKIQEVIARRQIMLVQVVKEERGTKGAALTTYLSLAGRYCVLMPNTPRGGGVSRKITSAADRKRLKEMLDDFALPEGMAVIVRTAGMERPKPEIKRDYEYLLRLWDEIRELTLKSSAPALIHEEGNLVKRAIRDLYQRDIDEVLVEGEDGYRTAKSFMKMIVPSHAKRVQPYRDPAIPLFHRFQVESQLDAIHSPTVQLRSGGYIVINPTEALVSIDVNSGRATRERHIEETALKTNIEAAEEVARQVRLRDLAGLIVIDFIDMEENRNNHAVERRLKEAMKNDRARIQIGKISPFGLLELSRQRLRPSLIEASSMRCPHCGGTGTVRSIESTALHVLRAIEEEGIRGKSAEIRVEVPSQVALYILNQKRDALIDTEARYHLKVEIGCDDSLVTPAYKLERLRQRQPGEEGAPVALPLPRAVAEEDDEDSGAAETEAETETETEGEEAEERVAEESNGEGGKRRRRRGRRRRRRGDEAGDQPSLDHEEPATALAEGEAGEEGHGEPQEARGEQRDEDGARRRRRRGKRGGRRHGRGPEGQRDGRDNGEAFAGEAPLNAPSPLIDSFAEHGEPVAGEARRADEPAPGWRRPSEDSDLPVSGETAAREPAAPPRRPSFLDKLDPPQRYVPAGWLSPVRGGESTEAAPQSESLAAPVAAPVPQAVAAPDSAVVPAASASSVREPEQEQEQEAEPNPAIQVTVVATPPEKPRRGWWGKLSGKD